LTLGEVRRAGKRHLEYEPIGAAELAVVVEEVAGRVGALLLVAEDEHDLGGPVAADGLEQVGVGAELDQEVGPGRAGELGVPRGVVAAAAGAAVAEAAVEEVGELVGELFERLSAAVLGCWP
jgi:hypothetical protein